ncbi:MAG: dTDP-4-dehydrorhamnose reductase [Sedimentisphaerales bacterium]|nr:dTDP-4-dehydrorhamnose reductase [Sedimentisphaerales bacterium]
MASRPVLILGSRGMLGSDLTRACTEAGIDNIGLDLPELDITDTARLKEAIQAAGAVVNCAAYTDVEAAEDNAAAAFKVNAEAVSRLGELAKKAGIWVLHISTDFVFDGTLQRPYTEKDTPNPICTYGRSKLAGEQLLQASGCHWCILRLQWTYGTNGRNFVTKLLDKARSGGQLRVVDDQIGSPTATSEAAKAICCLIRHRPEGIFHFASRGYTSRFGMAQFILDQMGLSNTLIPCKSTEYQSKAARSANSRFNCNKIRPFLDGPILPWQVPLKRFLETL